MRVGRSLAAIALLGSSLSLTNCASDRSEADVSTPPGLAAKVADLEQQTRTLRQQLLKAEMDRTQYSSVNIDPSTKAYQRLDTNVGTLLVSCQDVREYANGYKVSLHIGNVTLAKLNGFKMNVSWGPSFDDTTVVDWSTARHEAAFDVTDTLLPGKWNKVSLVLAPAKAGDLAYVTLDIEANSVSLLQ